MGTKLLKNLSLYTVGQLMTQLLSIILLPLYISKLTVEDYGVVASLMTVATFFNALMQYGMGPTIMRYYYQFEENPDGFKGFFTSVLLFNLLANSVLLIIVFFSYSAVFSVVLPDIEISNFIVYVILYSFCFSIPVLNLSLFRVESKPVKFLLFSLTQFLLSLSIIYYLVAILGKGAMGKIEGEFWARVPLFFIGFYLFRKYVDLSRIRLQYVVEALKYGLPLMLQAMLWWGLYRMDYFLINKYLGNEGVGLYNVGFQASFLLITLGISISLAWTPHFFSIAKHKETPEFYGDLIGNFLMILVLGGAFILIFVKDLLGLLDASKYFEITEFLPFLIIGAIFQAGYYIVQQLLFYAKKTKFIPMVLGGGGGLIFLLEYNILPKSGLVGLSIVKMGGFILIFALTFYVGNLYYKVVLNIRKLQVASILLIVNACSIIWLNLAEYSMGIKVLFFLMNIFVLSFSGFLSPQERKFIFSFFK